MDDLRIISECLKRIEKKYARRGKSELWDDDTREEFMRAFAMVPIQLLCGIVDEVLLNPPTDDRGREINWLPDPSDVVRVARKLTSQVQMTPTDIVSEIIDAVQEFGIYGQRHPTRPNIYLPGQPNLSPMAAYVVNAMGGWGELCSSPTPSGVLNGLLLKHASNAVETMQKRLLIAGQSSSMAITDVIGELLPEGK